MTEDTHDPASDPVQAFENLRAEVSMMRRAVEALPGAWEENQPPDYSPDLGRIAKSLDVVIARLDAINKHPALMMTPEQHRQAIAQAGSGLMGEAAQKLGQVIQGVEHERQQLAGLIGAARRQDEQRNWLLWAASGALVVGLLVSPFVASVLPFGLDSRIAALIMKNNRWDAGGALMQAGNPGDWRLVEDATDLVRINQEALAACREAAARAKQDQRCTITVPAQ